MGQSNSNKQRRCTKKSVLDRALEIEAKVNQYQHLSEIKDSSACMECSEEEYYYFPGILDIRRKSSDPEIYFNIVESYLNAGAKLNTMNWGLFSEKGKRSAIRPYVPSCRPVIPRDSMDLIIINRPRYICTAAILLLQHGVDPNFYSFVEMINQHTHHLMVNQHRHHLMINRHSTNCIDEETFLTTFLSAGYKFTTSDTNDIENGLPSLKGTYTLAKDHGHVTSLKQLCRTNIRNHIRSVNRDTSVFPIIDNLILPTIMKDYLKLWDVSPVDLKSTICCSHTLFV